MSLLKKNLTKEELRSNAKDKFESAKIYIRGIRRAESEIQDLQKRISDKYADALKDANNAIDALSESNGLLWSLIEMTEKEPASTVLVTQKVEDAGELY